MRQATPAHDILPSPFRFCRSNGTLIITTAATFLFSTPSSQARICVDVMKKLHLTGVAMAALSLVLLALTTAERPATTLTYGTPDLQSLGALAFGPDNLLLAGDATGAAVFALDVQDNTEAADLAGLNVEGIDQKIAALLGTTADAIRVNDLAVHPTSQQVYLSVARGDAPALLRVTKAGALEVVSLDDIGFSKGMITSAPAPDATDRRGRSLRTNTITDLAYANGKVYVAGLSNEEFASHFRQLAFPFSEDAQSSSLEIFHVAHGQYETHAPVRTFMPYAIGDAPHILAAYTCTPLVAFPVGDLAEGAHVKGKTVAELGNRNAPLDMVAFEKDGNEHLLIANSSRGVMMLDAADLPGAESLTEPVETLTAGVGYTTLSWEGVVQLAMLNAEQVIVLEEADGALNLRSYATSTL